ncbi:glutaminyl-peptide cyclotransferase [Apibacter muscae]|uniref:glutaminyl-peptide cyclotransferase n=1 Tax=Apibacter muscae TaxID=2509004 RepID=UPI0011AB99C0|nr:glutaminyl-peptide cyclotransferase [Apibacter muscae]TWP24669.1 glutaminyl-peptide cyclotransferase [Apibacter muscae]
MKAFVNKLIIGTILLMVAIGCKDSNKISISTNFDQLSDKGLHMGDKLPLEISSEDGTIDSYTVKLNGKDYESNNIILDSTNSTLGANTLVVNVNYNGNHKKEIETVFNIYSNVKEKEFNYSIIQEYPHNPELFTQGFTYKNGVITESSGLYEKSKLVRYHLGETTFKQSISLAPQFFAEGFAVLNNKLYLLTWREKTLLIYNQATFELEKQQPYPNNLSEGWGATTIGDDIVVSDGSSKLKFYDQNFNLKRTISAIGYNQIYSNLNELEYANGLIYANVFEQPIILAIDPKTGVVVAKADFSDLAKKNQTNADAVLNGIAHVEENHFLITGKLWSKIYKVIFQD